MKWVSIYTDVVQLHNPVWDMHFHTWSTLSVAVTSDWTSLQCPILIYYYMMLLTFRHSFLKFKITRHILQQLFEITKLQKISWGYSSINVYSTSPQGIGLPFITPDLNKDSYGKFGFNCLYKIISLLLSFFHSHLYILKNIKFVKYSKRLCFCTDSGIY